MKKLNSMIKTVPKHPQAKFLSEKPELWMFVPSILVNGKWVVLEEPLTMFYKPDSGCQKYPQECYEEDLKQYQQAKEMVIFEGFEVVGCGEWSDDELIEIENKNGVYLIYDPEDKHFIIEEEITVKTIEDLVPFILTLK